MSKLKRLLGALSLVALFIFSSCVDDEIAPEVTALRQAQVDLLNAEVATEQAFTVWQAADAAYRQAQADNQVLLNAGVTLANELTASNNAKTILDNMEAMEASALVHQADLLAKQEALAIAERDFANFLATQGLDEAGDWFAAWNKVMNGPAGTIQLPGQPNTTTITNGVIPLTEDIDGDKQDLALLNLVRTGPNNNGIPQSVVIARAEEGVVATETALAGLNASLVAAQAVVDGEENPAAELQALLLSLAADTVAQNARIDSIDAVIKGIDDLTAEADSIVAAFEHTAGVMAVNWVDSADDYLAVEDAIGFAEDSLAIAAADTALYLVYADSLQAIYDEYFTEIDEFDELLADLREDSTTTADALAAGAAGAVDEELALEEAFATYVAAERVFKRIVAEGGTPTNGDTTAFVTARRAWDGFAEDEIFAARPGVLTDIINDVTSDTYNVDGTTTPPTVVTFPFKTTSLAADDLINGGVPTAVTFTSKFVMDGADGGALQIFLDASNSDLLLEDYEDALFALESVVDFYQSAVTEFENLSDAISDLKDFSSTATVPYAAGLGTVIPDLADASGFFNNYATAIDGAGDVISDNKDGVSSSLSTANEKKVDGTRVQFVSAKDAKDAADDLIDRLDDLNDELADLLPFVELYLEDYEAASDLLEDAADEQAAALIAPNFARYGAIETLNMLVAEMGNVQDQIDALDNEILQITSSGNSVESVPQVIFTDNSGNDYTEVGSPTDMAGAGTVYAFINTADVDGAEDAVTAAQYSVAQAEQGLVDITAAIAELEAEIAAKETELVVLQAMADAIQEALLAVLAG